VELTAQNLSYTIVPSTVRVNGICVRSSHTRGPVFQQLYSNRKVVPDDYFSCSFTTKRDAYNYQ